MKRHPALAELSRDHQHVLAVAQRLRRATPGAAAQATAAFRAFWEAQGRAHLRIEEEILLPAFASRGDPRNPAIVRTLVEHMEIRCSASRVANGDAALVRLHQLGDQLAAHVRLEERELFPLIETTLSTRELESLGGELLAAALRLAGSERGDA